MISCCLIHRDDPHLAKTIESIRPYVAEICIVSEVENPVARALADRFQICTDYLDENGRLNNFGAMRQKSFDLATQPWVLWLDSDDIVEGGEHLAGLVEHLKGSMCPRVLFKYEYAYKNGKVDAVQWRERLVKNDGSHRWKRHGHEKLVSVSGIVNDIPVWDVIVKHQRTAQKESGLNLRLLRLDAAENYGDAAFEIGTECQIAGLYEEAIGHLIYEWNSSGWDDQRALAALKVAECTLALDAMGDHSGARLWAERAEAIRPEWPEPQLFLGRLALLRACAARGDQQRIHMEYVVRRCDRAIAGKNETPLAIRPLEQSVNAYALKQAAHETLDQWEEALACVQTVIDRQGEDVTLRLSERTYLEKLGRLDAPGRMDIVFAAPAWSSDPWDPVVLKEKGLGGSETAVVEMAKRLAAFGHRVRVFGLPEIPGLYDGVEYHTFSDRNDVDCDVLVAWRLAPMLEWCEAKVRLMWVHDTTAHAMTNRLALKADAILALSQWHKDNLVKQHRVHPDHVRVTRNGIDVKRFARTDIARNPHRAIYSSSPDRGLAVLIDMWPRIRAQVPDAELKVFYGFANWRKGLAVRDDIQHRYVIAHCEERMAALASEGVTFCGQVDQDTLANEMLGAGVFAYPTWFSETFCIGALEAQAAGLRIVTSPIAALKETVAVGSMVFGDWLSPEYQDAFVDEVVAAMSEERYLRHAPRETIQQAVKAKASWDGVAAEWDTMMRELLAASEYGALPPYCAVAA